MECDEEEGCRAPAAGAHLTDLKLSASSEDYHQVLQLDARGIARSSKLQQLQLLGDMKAANWAAVAGCAA